MMQRVVTITEFKAKCLALLDEIGEKGGTITVTKRGRPLAIVGPSPALAWKSPEGMWAEKIAISEKLLGMDASAEWEVLQERRDFRH